MNLRNLRKKIPVSISELNYKDHDLFIAFMTFTVTYTAVKEYYASAAAFTLVYVFRYFHRKNQTPWHYAFAIAGFTAMAIQSWIFWPIILGSAVFILNKVLHTKREVFWFEMFAGIPYLLLI